MPIMVLTFLSPIGLLLPADTGEKMGLQITVMLTVITYLNVVQDSVPVFTSSEQSPYILDYFLIATTFLCLSLLVSTHTLYLGI